MIKKTTLILSLLFLGTNTALANLTYQNKPVSPACLAQLASQDTEKASVDLKQCTSANSYIRKNGNIISNRRQNPGELKPFAEYSIIGQRDQHYLINLQQWTGGSGVFTYVLWLEKKNNRLTLIKTIASGDRCNSGSTRSGEWQFAVNLTPYSMLVLEDALLQLKPYSDLDDSAASCIAKAYYQFDPQSEKVAFSHVILNTENQLSDDWSKKIKYQACFNELVKTFIKKNQVRLNIEELNLFKRMFDKECKKGS